MSGSWMSIIEYAREYNVSDMTVRRRIKTGRLNAELREGKYYIPVGESPGEKPQEASMPHNYSTKEVQKERREHSPRLIHSVTEHEQLEIKIDQLAENIEGALEKLSQHEELMKQNFESERKRLEEKINFLEKDFQNKEKDISLLKREIEDLETLVKILEQKSS